jgi:hypothetical protein
MPATATKTPMERTDYIGSMVHKEALGIIQVDGGYIKDGQ